MSTNKLHSSSSQNIISHDFQLPRRVVRDLPIWLDWQYTIITRLGDSLRDFDSIDLKDHNARCSIMEAMLEERKENGSYEGYKKALREYRQKYYDAYFDTHMREGSENTQDLRVVFMAYQNAMKGQYNTPEGLWDTLQKQLINWARFDLHPISQRVDKYISKNTQGGDASNISTDLRNLLSIFPDIWKLTGHNEAYKELNDQRIALHEKFYTYRIQEFQSLILKNLSDRSPLKFISQETVKEVCFTLNQIKNSFQVREELWRIIDQNSQEMLQEIKEKYHTYEGDSKKIVKDSFSNLVYLRAQLHLKDHISLDQEWVSVTSENMKKKWWKRFFSGFSWSKG